MGNIKDAWDIAKEGAELIKDAIDKHKSSNELPQKYDKDANQILELLARQDMSPLALAQFLHMDIVDVKYRLDILSEGGALKGGLIYRCNYVTDDYCITNKGRKYVVEILNDQSIKNN